MDDHNREPPKLALNVETPDTATAEESSWSALSPSSQVILSRHLLSSFDIPIPPPVDNSGKLLTSWPSSTDGYSDEGNMGLERSSGRLCEAVDIFGLRDALHALAHKAGSPRASLRNSRKRLVTELSVMMLCVFGLVATYTYLDVTSEPNKVWDAPPEVLRALNQSLNCGPPLPAQCPFTEYGSATLAACWLLGIVGLGMACLVLRRNWSWTIARRVTQSPMIWIVWLSLAGVVGTSYAMSTTNLNPMWNLLYSIGSLFFAYQDALKSRPRIGILVLGALLITIEAWHLYIATFSCSCRAQWVLTLDLCSFHRTFRSNLLVCWVKNGAWIMVDVRNERLYFVDEPEYRSTYIDEAASSRPMSLQVSKADGYDFHSHITTPDAQRGDAVLREQSAGCATDARTLTFSTMAFSRTERGGDCKAGKEAETGEHRDAIVVSATRRRSMSLPRGSALFRGSTRSSTIEVAVRGARILTAHNIPIPVTGHTPQIMALLRIYGLEDELRRTTAMEAALLDAKLQRARTQCRPNDSANPAEERGVGYSCNHGEKQSKGSGNECGESLAVTKAEYDAAEAKAAEVARLQDERWRALEFRRRVYGMTFVVMGIISAIVFFVEVMTLDELPAVVGACNDTSAHGTATDVLSSNRISTYGSAYFGDALRHQYASAFRATIGTCAAISTACGVALAWGNMSRRVARRMVSEPGIWILAVYLAFTVGLEVARPILVGSAQYAVCYMLVCLWLVSTDLMIVRPPQRLVAFVGLMIIASTVVPIVWHSQCPNRPTGSQLLFPSLENFLPVGRCEWMRSFYFSVLITMVNAVFYCVVDVDGERLAFCTKRPLRNTGDAERVKGNGYLKEQYLRGRLHSRTRETYRRILRLERVENSTLSRSTRKRATSLPQTNTINGYDQGDLRSVKKNVKRPQSTRVGVTSSLAHVEELPQPAEEHAALNIV